MLKLADLSGHWAVVTGASSGIGAEFCRQLVAAGVHVVLVARREQLLEKLATTLRTEQTHVLVVPMDLSERGSAARLFAAVTEKKIVPRLLVNNAAFGPWGSFDQTSADDYERLVQLLSGTPIALCRLFADALGSHSTSAIINVGSPAGLQPIPYLAAYAAAKACMNQFSIALYGEWNDRGIVVQTLLPAPTATEFDAKGGAYASELGDRRAPPSELVGLSLGRLEGPVVTNAKGIFTQRLFAGLAPWKTLVKQVKKMFLPPPGR